MKSLLIYRSFFLNDGFYQNPQFSDRPCVKCPTHMAEDDALDKVPEV